MVNYCSQKNKRNIEQQAFQVSFAQVNCGHSHSQSIHSRLMFKYRQDLVCPSLRSRNSRNFVGGNHESRTTDKENPVSKPM